jgi:8-oxo-dGTP pyrophosphatase MutT (NUDIX family)
MPRSSPSRRRDGQRRTEETDLRRNQAGAGNPAEDTASAPANDAAESAAGSHRAARAKREPAAKREGGAKRDTTARREGTGRREAAAKRRSGRRRRPGPWLSRVDEVSAGGLVVDLRGDVPRGALIGRTDRHGRLLWSLPKGHIEPGETAEQAAVREVAEETGIEGVIVATLGTIDFWFIADGRRIHKTVHHYLLRAVSGELSDADIEVTEVAWVPLPDISGQLAYPDERGLVHTAGRLLAESA